MTISISKRAVSISRRIAIVSACATLMAAAAFAQEAEVVAVTATGHGETIEEAKKDAGRNAILEVVGELLDAETLVENDEVVKDEILTYSGAYMEDLKVVGVPVRDQATGLYETKVEAKVRKTQLAKTIHGKLVDKVSIRGGLKKSGKAKSGGSVAALDTSFADFPASLLRTAVCRDENGVPMFRTDAKGMVDVKIGLSVDSDAYRAWADELSRKLEAAAGSSENVTVSARMADSATDQNMAGLQQQMQNLAQQYPGMMANVQGMGQAQEAVDFGSSLALSPPQSWAQDGFTVGVVQPGQDRVWNVQNGTVVPLRTKSYSFSGGAAAEVRTLFDKIRGVKASPASGAPFGMPRPTESGKDHSINLFVFVMAGSSELAKVRVHPEIVDKNPWGGGNGLPTPFWAALVPLPQAPRLPAANVCVVPFVVQDAAHCFPSCEVWVPLGMFDEEDLKTVTDVRVEYATE